MDSLISVLPVALCTSVFAVIWVNVLTTPQAIFRNIPLYYGDGFLRSVFTCEKCLSGWLAMISVFSSEFYTLISGSGYVFYVCQSFTLILRTILAGVLGIYMTFLISRNMNK